MKYLDKQDMDKLAIGAALLGTGGGGDPYVGKLMAQQSIDKYGPVQMITIDELAADATVATFAMVGAPTVLVEKIPNFESFDILYEEFVKYNGDKIDAVMPIEAGGVNSMIPIIFAAIKEVPIVDADGMGRAFPEMQMDTFNVNGIHNTPAVFADEKGNTAILNTSDGLWTEKIARSLTTVMGGSILNGVYLLSRQELHDHAIHHTVSTSIAIGETLTTSKQPIEDLQVLLDGTILFRGKIQDVVRRTDGGFVKGTATLTGLDADKDATCKIEFQNENLVCLVDDVPRCTTPDLITVLDLETGMPITTEGLKFGARCVVFAQPADDKWKTEAGIRTVGPGYFGYDYDYIPLEKNS
ncbi:DUF917 domain-containing protein [Salinicoccus sp. ID82-1]|uniref:DUF917 domain-containing protein n=1 Tax=Salinicoccus sp. ID82-1 TaxID=2820269 RepID=UPI001F38BBD1|nr:DUF917 domain-containing protein [Salinicoccus sp. ID82-1]MCG1008432.1 DUF917 domain-containing protein [Salinicoccus sp. ID82-1]